MTTSLRLLGLALALLSAPALAAGGKASGKGGGGGGGGGGGAKAAKSAPVVEDTTDGDMRGVTLMAGVGAEGYTGPLASRIQVGPQWGVAVVFKPSVVLGIEIAYTGSVDRFDASRLVGTSHTTGASVIRHGAHAAVTVGLTASRFQPYLLAGVGINRYIPIGAADTGYRSVANATLPLGAGFRTYFVGKFTLDVRATYSLSFGNNFAGGVGALEGLSNDAVRDIGRWGAMAFFGYTF